MNRFSLGSFFLGILSVWVLAVIIGFVWSPGYEKDQKEKFMGCASNSGNSIEWCYDYSQD